MPTRSLHEEGLLWWRRGGGGHSTVHHTGEGQRTRAVPGLYLEGLDEGPLQDADSVALAQQLDEPGSTEEAEKAEVDEIVL